MPWKGESWRTVQQHLNALEEVSPSLLFKPVPELLMWPCRTAGDLGIREWCACIFRDKQCLFRGFSGCVERKHPPNTASLLLVNKEKFTIRVYACSHFLSFPAALCPEILLRICCAESAQVKAAKLRLIGILVTIY